tara:strand:+ start:309 stop:1850 length:1542 start_codon:yes stop_codon:yes gene_type:complete
MQQSKSIEAAGDALADAIKSYKQNKAEKEFYTDRIEGLESYVNEMEGAPQEVRDDLAKTIEAAGKGSLSQMKAAFADLNFKIDRFDKDRAFEEEKRQSKLIEGIRERGMLLQENQRMDQKEQFRQRLQLDQDQLADANERFRKQHGLNLRQFAESQEQFDITSGQADERIQLSREQIENAEAARNAELAMGQQDANALRTALGVIPSPSNYAPGSTEQRTYEVNRGLAQAATPEMLKTISDLRPDTTPTLGQNISAFKQTLRDYDPIDPTTGLPKTPGQQQLDVEQIVIDGLAKFGTDEKAVEGIMEAFNDSGYKVSENKIGTVMDLGKQNPAAKGQYAIWTSNNQVQIFRAGQGKGQDYDEDFMADMGNDLMTGTFGTNAEFRDLVETKVMGIQDPEKRSRYMSQAIELRTKMKGAMVTGDAGALDAAASSKVRDMMKRQGILSRNLVVVDAEKRPAIQKEIDDLTKAIDAIYDDHYKKWKERGNDMVAPKPPGKEKVRTFYPGRGPKGEFE